MEELDLKEDILEAQKLLERASRRIEKEQEQKVFDELNAFSLLLSKEWPFFRTQNQFQAQEGH